MTTVVIDRRTVSGTRCWTTAFRLSDTAGLEIGHHGIPVNELTAKLLKELMATPGVSHAYLVRAATAEDEPEKLNIITSWLPNADSSQISQAAWAAMQRVLPNLELRRAFWQAWDERRL